MNLQAQRELRYLSKFKDNFVDFPPGEVRCGRPPEPDVVIELSSGDIVGIEVTELYKDEASGSSSKSRESEQNKVIRAARCQLEDDGVSPLDVAVYFDPDATMKKRDREALIRWLVDFVSEHLPTSEGNFTFNNTFDGSFPESVSGIRISRFFVLSRHHWSVPNAAYVQSNFVRGLQSRIAEKAVRYKSYKQVCERCWLLVVADGFEPSSLFDLNGSTLSQVYESPFERTFFLEAFSGRWFELHASVAS